MGKNNLFMTTIPIRKTNFSDMLFCCMYIINVYALLDEIIFCHTASECDAKSCCAFITAFVLRMLESVVRHGSRCIFSKQNYFNLISCKITK